MRTLLRHRISGLFFQGVNQWTENAEQAYDFRFIDRAMHFADTWELGDVELAFTFEEPYSIQTAPLERSSMRYAA
jgi:hypothetical protein